MVKKCANSMLPLDFLIQPLLTIKDGIPDLIY